MLILAFLASFFFAMPKIDGAKDQTMHREIVEVVPIKMMIKAE